MNFLRVEVARPCVRKEKRCCSREEMLNPSVAVEELESARESISKLVVSRHQELVGLKRTSYGRQLRVVGGVKDA